MRTRATSEAGLAVRGIAGTYVVLLGFNVAEAQREGLLGFAVRRTDHTEKESSWLRGQLYFKATGGDLGSSTPTSVSPIQKFRWGDYTAKPLHEYTYEVHAMCGRPGALEDRDSVEVRVRTEDPWDVGKSGHAVHFNRAAAASQAYVTKFGNRDPNEVSDGAAFRWLSRGLEESLVSFLGRAGDEHDSLHLCVYEFQKDSLLEAVREAVGRRVHVEVVYDAIRKGEGPRTKNRTAIRKHGLTAVCHPREGIRAISHHKFVVLCHDGRPRALWTGSTNFTEGAIYGQANVGHAVEDSALAGKFLELHQALMKDPDLRSSRKNAESLSPVPPGGVAQLYPMFSPRSSLAAIDICKDLIDDAKDLVCFTAPFALHPRLQDALDDPEDRFLKFGLLNKRGNVVERVHRTAGNRIAAAARLETALDHFQEELFHHKGVFIHTKFILVDPLSDRPALVTGSANFSANSCEDNDENQLVIFGQPAVADVYLGEFMRLYDHYAFRDFVKQAKKKPEERYLCDDDSWTDKYFAGGLAERDRVAFSA